MSWNNVLPWWFYEIEIIVDELQENKITYEEFVDKVTSTSVPEHTKEHLIRVWHPDFEGDND